MKYTHALCILVLVSACHNNLQGPPQYVDTSQAATAVPDGSVKKDNPADAIHDTVLYIGQSARWKKTADDIWDGSYDSTSGFFNPCGQSKLIKVQREYIEYEMVSNCDTSLSSRVKLYDLLIRDSTPLVLPHQVALVNPDQLNSSAVHFVNGQETIALKPAQQMRVQAIVTARKNMLIRQQLK